MSLGSAPGELVSPAEMPSPEAYEDEYRFWPWQDLIKRAAAVIAERAPQGATVIDYMCATGYLLTLVRAARPDIIAKGCDIHRPFVDYARESRPTLDIVHEDVRRFRFDVGHDVIVCTGGLHHLRFEEQGRFLRDLRSVCGNEFLVVLGEEILAPFATEQERVRAAVELDTALLNLGLAEGWPHNVLTAAALVLRNDVLQMGEYKRDLRAWSEVITEHFRIDDVIQTWAPPRGGGDFLFLCRVK